MGKPPKLLIDGHVLEEIRQQGAKTYPHECCGALLGRDRGAVGDEADADARTEPREILALVPLVNRREDSPRNRFSLTGEDVRKAEQAAEEQGLELIGWYHSHPDYPARPSDYDREYAWPWYSYIIVSVQKGTPQETTSWRLDENRSTFAPEELKIRQAAISEKACSSGLRS